MSLSTNAPLPPIPSAERDHRLVDGVRLHVVTAGDPEDPLVVFLHGFPEFWYEWRGYVERFVDAGYRVLIPDQRGYNLSEKPHGIAAYRLPRLSSDVAGLIASEGKDTAHVIGHDWGAVVAWDLVLRRPAVVDRLGIVNVPHPSVFGQTLRTNPRQLLKSWYIYYFQIPRLPEWGSRRADFALWRRAMVGPAKPGTFTDTDLERYRRAWSEPGAPTAMINWYRAMVRHRDGPPRDRVQAPTLVVWGERDQALVPEMAPMSIDYCEDGTLARFPSATHWVIHEHPDRVSELLLDHLAGRSPGG
ncbi:alpha/beta fold hydrolase [Natrarchaeobaculum aegyptiacum]|uniref:Alpha/beta hydrolase n=1 Tax=Natrarchaeobaculum aegyptiacum TaxID=745377 RepID=A0A2Z2HQ07_9EURY|nr:alpha/beta fold hydrolase [Natrarchaeobaculum aegyptiacum]ARS89176.1 alpha/beta hydrolase [Natrarchaeobaculum aegyptiacum]